MTASTPAPLAIVGIGCRFPGDATTPEKLWDLLAGGRSAWSKVPADRWNENAFWHPSADDRNGTHNHSGGHFLRQDVGAFDATFFGLNPQEAAAMDPQQRLLLEATYEALENAGIPQEDIRGSNTSVHMAMFTRDYDRNTYKDMMSIPKYHVTGTGEAILANRISHLFDLHGPSMTLDTGCSGGMTAVYQACQGLRSGATDLALAGAANLILSPDHMISMSNLHMLSAEGKSFSFDHRGAGYGRGEGIATLVIKRLDDAIRARDPIRAVIREAIINQDGHTAGITLPSGAAQARLERQAWSNIGLSPTEAGYVEAHGTGTAAGDQAELEGISEIFCEHRDTPLFVGSLKSNIGHLESVSGLAALVKATMILEKNAIPPNVNFEKPKEGLDLEQKRITVPQAVEPWRQPGVPRVSVNSFGYGGTNAHAILERAPRPRGDHAASTTETPRLFVLSAKNQASLLKILSNTQDWASQADQTSLRDLSYTLSQRRSLLQWRFSCVAANSQELVEGLQKGSKPDGITRSRSDLKLNFIFTGQGAQWPGMGRELLSVPVFAESMRRSAEILRDLGSKWDLIEELLRTENSRLKEAELAQPTTTAVQIALVDLARELGIVPDAVVGHSSGEIGAAYAAGFLDEHTALKAAFHRGFSSSIAKQKGKGSGGMMAVGLGETDIAPYLKKLKQGCVVVACQNSPSSATVSGDDAALTELSELLTSDSVFNRRLQVDTAYHSHHMQAAANDYKDSLGFLRVDTSPKRVKFFSSVTGKQERRGFDADYWVSNLVSKVRFCDALQALCLNDQESSESTPSHQIFIEIGPHSALAGPARQCLSDLPEQIPYDYNSALVRGTGALQSLLSMVGKLFDRGYSLDLEAVAALDPESEDAVVLHDLPTYSWDHAKRHWHLPRQSRDYLMRSQPYHDLLGLRMTDNSPLRPVWRHLVGLDGLPWLADHVVDGLVIFPGSGYLCMAMEAASQLAQERYENRKVESLVLKDVSFLKGLVIPAAPERVEIQLALRPLSDDGTHSLSMQHHFTVTTYKEGETWAEHCSGVVVVEFPASNGEYGALSCSQSEDLLPRLNIANGKILSSKELYTQLNAAGNTYGPSFSGIDQFTATNDYALSNITIPDVAAVMPANHMRPHLIHPTTLDILLHSSLPLVTAKTGVGSIMPVHINEIAVSSTISSSAGSQLTAATMLTSAEFRTAEADLLVFAGAESDSSAPVISVSTMELRNLGSSSEGASENESRELCYELKWGTDADFLSSQDLQLPEDLPSPKERLYIMDKATGIYIRRCIQRIRHEGLNVPEEYHQLLLRWMESTEPNPELSNISQLEDEIVKLVPQQGVEGEFLARLGPALPTIMTGETNALQLMLEDDLLYRVYADESSARCYTLMSEYLKHKSFKQADLSVLEIGGGTGGATLPFLEALDATGARPSVFDFTDVSAGFFEKAREKLQGWSEAVNYRPLDIEKDPDQQGFKPHTYDIVLACNVLHATASVTETLSRVRSLLKPDGVLLLIEVTNPQRYLNITFGTLPGWWKGADEGRDTGPFLSADGWSTAMSQSALEMQLASDDDKLSPVSSFMVAKAIDDSTSPYRPRVRVISEGNVGKGLRGLSTFGNQIIKELKSQNWVTFKSVWADDLPWEDVVNVIIDDAANPLLEHVSADRFRQISSLLKKPSKIVWVSAQDHDNHAGDPRKHLVNGLARTAHAENEDLQMVTIDVQQGLLNGEISDLTQNTLKIIRSVGSTEKLTEREYVYDGNNMLIPRVLPSQTLNRWVSDKEETPVVQETTFNESSRPLRLDTTSKDFRINPVFVDDEYHKRPLGDDDVEIEAKAFGVPSRTSRYIANEFAGVVTAVGSNVKHLGAGDRVVAFGATPFASQPRVPSSQVQLLSNRVSYQTAAALPVSLMTALYALENIADIEPGQSVIVDGATNELGQAAVAVAQHLGANVIAAVSRQDDSSFITERLQLAPGQIVPRKGFLCKRMLQKLAGRNGVDIILECSGLPASNELEQMIKPFGTLVRVGANAGLENTGSGDGSSSPNTTVSSFDLESLIQARPTKAAELFTKAIRLTSLGMQLPVNGITIKPIPEIETAIKQSQLVDNREKVVLDVTKDSTVQAIEPTREVLRLRSDATYVVSGGLGDLGKRYLRIMAAAGAKHLVTLSRSGAKGTEHQDLQSELQQILPGCKLHCGKCDISSLDGVEAALAEIKGRGFPPVKGMVQAAVVLNDSTLDTMTAPAFNGVLDTKLDGTLNLDQVFAREGLDFFISLSSAVGVIGTSGQANYNAGNTVQDALAQFSRDSGCHYMSLNIGTIEGADATVNNQSRIQALLRQGLTPIEPNELKAFFEYSMCQQARDAGCQQAVIGFTPESLAATTAANGAAHTRMFTHVRETTKAETTTGEVAQKQTFRDVVAATKDEDELAAFVVGSVRDKLAVLIGIETAELDPDTSIADFGLDSLIAIELRNWIMREFEAPIQSSEILSNQNLLALAKKIAGRSRLAAAAAAAGESDASSSAGSRTETEGASTQPSSPATSEGVMSDFKGDRD